MSNEQSNNRYLNKYRDEQGQFRSRNKRKKYCTCCGKLLWKRDFYRTGKRCSSRCKECQRKIYRERYIPKRKDGFYLDDKGRSVEWRNGVMRIDWTPQMESELKRYYPTTRNKELMELFMVSEYSIRKKAKELGLSKDKDFLLKEARFGGYLGGYKTKKLLEKRRAYLSQASSFNSK